MYYDGGEQLSLEQVDVVTKLNDKNEITEYRKITTDPEATVVLSNILLENMPDLSLNASKLFDSIVATLPSFPDKEEEALKIMETQRFIKIVVSDLVAGWESLDQRVAYDVVKQTLAELNSKPFAFEYIDKKGKKHTFSSVLVSTYHYIDQQGYAEVEISAGFAPYLVALKKNFTMWRLGYSYSFSSINSKRIYELLVQYRSIGTRTFTVADFKSMLHITDKYKGNNYNLKKKVIEPSCQEINKKSDLIVTYEMNGRGERATITFKLNPRPTSASKKGYEKGRGVVPQESIDSIAAVMVNDLELDKLFTPEEIENVAADALRAFQGDSIAGAKALIALSRAKDGYDNMVKKGTDIKSPKNYFRSILESKCEDLQTEE